MLSQVKDHQIKQLAEAHAKALIVQSSLEIAKIQAESQLKQAVENKEKYNGTSTNSLYQHFEKREQYWNHILNYIDSQVTEQ